MTAPSGKPDSPWERLEWHEPSETWRPWEPPSAPQLAAAELSYVVVDEIVGDAVGLSVSAWPAADDQGRLRFADHGRGRLVGTSLNELQKWVDDKRVVRATGLTRAAQAALKRRPIAIGDVFAAKVAEDVVAAPAETVLGPPINDITVDAREAAKVAFYGAVTEPLAPEEVDDWISRADEDDEPPTATGTPMPVPR